MVCSLTVSDIQDAGSNCYGTILVIISTFCSLISRDQRSGGNVPFC